jgi:hypothetical protein
MPPRPVTEKALLTSALIMNAVAVAVAVAGPVAARRTLVLNSHADLLVRAE